MYEKIKSMPRLTVAAICIIMLFFPFIASEDNVSGLECIQTNGLSILLLLIPVFIILVDLNVSSFPTIWIQNAIDLITQTGLSPTKEWALEKVSGKSVYLIGEL